MTEYLVSFQDEWVGEHTEEWFRGRSRLLRPLLAEMREQDVLIFTGGLDDTTPLVTVAPTDDGPVFSDGPYAETKEHLGGFAVIRTDDEAAAREWAGRIAVACGWPQALYRFQVPPASLD